MTNDCMFRTVLQRNNYVLKGLLCSLLYLKPESITSVEITNPIELGETADDKEFILDINVLMNNHAVINLEMQMAYQLVNTKTHDIYSDKFILRVVNLKQIDLATEDDRANHIDYWARLFTATSWEDITNGLHMQYNVLSPVPLTHR